MQQRYFLERDLYNLFPYKYALPSAVFKSKVKRLKEDKGQPTRQRAMKKISLLGTSDT